MANQFKFQPSKISEAVNKKLVIKRLPEFMQNIEQIQMFFDEAIQPWFNPEEQEISDGYIGDRSTPAAVGRIFLNENDASRQEYQFSPAYVSRNDDKSIRSLQFYPDLVGFLGSNGSITSNESRLFGSKIYSWTPPINPNKMVNYSSYFWDNENEYNIPVDYVVMERGSLNGNTWSLQNYWYSIGQELSDGSVLTDELAQTSRFIRASAPIIEYNKNMELVNYGTKFRGVVDYFSDNLKPEDIVQKRLTDNVRIDGNLLKEGDRILFTSIGNSGENNRIYKTYIKTMEDNTKVYGLALDEDEQYSSRPTGEPHTGDVVLIRKGTVNANKTFYWNGKSWIQAQAKTGVNVSPLFVLYDRTGTKLNDVIKYPGSNFTGSEIFGFKINYNFGLDGIYQKHIELSDLNYYIFENYIQSTKYEYLRNGVVTEIPGFYYFNIIEENSNSELVSTIKTDWIRSEEDSKQYVHQVQNVTKNSMYRVFGTLYEMNNFNAPIEGMYAFVIENSTTYQYSIKSGSSALNWNVINSEAVSYDVYNTKYEVSQKIAPNSDDEIQVLLNGESLLASEYSTILNSDGFVDFIEIKDKSKLNDDSLITIRTYSKDITPNKELGDYEVPNNLRNDPMNGKIEYIHAGLYTLHFQEIIRKNITSGAVDDTNDYEARLTAGLVNNAVGTQIIQNESSLLPLMLSTTNDNINLFDAIMFNQSEYFRFKNRFNNVMIQLYNANPQAFLAKPATIIVDEILTKLNIGKGAEFPFAIDLVGSSSNINRTYIPATPQFLGILGAFKPQKATFMHVGNGVGCYNVDHTGTVSKAFVVNNQVPLMDDVVYELENRIYNSIDVDFKNTEYVPILNEFNLNPSAFYTDAEYSRDEYTSLSLRGYTNFIATNQIDTTARNYDKNNWMTWNFTGTTYVVDGNITDIPARGSWRAVYKDMYGTYRPHTHPWEMFGFSQRPDWFNNFYKSTKVQIGKNDFEYMYVYEATFTDQNGNVQSNKLWDFNGVKGDVSTGVIRSGSRQGTHAEFKHFGTVPFTIVNTGEIANNGEPIKTVQLISPVQLGMISGALNHLGEPWKFGDLGDIEFAYSNTPMFAFDRALTLLRAKPAKFASYYYDTKNSNLKKVKNGGYQFQYGETDSRLNLNASTLVHYEEDVRVLGYQMWISDYLISENKNVTKNYGDILRSSGVNIGHRLGGYSKVENLTFKSDSFGLVSQENQQIGLVKSSVIKEAIYSSLKVTWTGDGYSINGYDLVNPVFEAQNFNKTGKRTTVSSGNLSVVHYNQFINSTTSYEYGTLLKTPQEVYNFIRGYGEYLEKQGWIFEDIDSNGEIYNWDNIAKSYLDWTLTNKSLGEYLVLSPSTANAKFGSNFGSVLSVTQYSGGVWSLLDSNGSGIRPDEINTSRIGNVFSVRLESDTKQMALIRLNLVSFEHAIIFDDKTIFGDYIYMPVYGSIHEMLKLYGYITSSWNGRLEAPGFMVLENGTLPNFEKLVNDFTKYYDNDNPTDNNDINSLSRHLIGFQSRNYLREMITADTAQVDFYKGYIKEKGTRQAFEKVLRVSKTYNTENYKALEEWAFKVGSYGNINGKKHLQFQLINNEIKQQPQLVVFDTNATKDTDDSTIQYFGENGVDSRWITRPNGKFGFPMRSGGTSNISLPNIGPVTTNEVDIISKDFSTVSAVRLNYYYMNKVQPQSAWILRDLNSEWNIFNIVNTGLTIESIEVNQSDVNEQSTYCTITLSGAHGMKNGDYYFFNDDSGYMPDKLQTEREYYISTDTDNSFIIPLELVNDIVFTDNKPVLYVYRSKFNTIADKEAYVNKKYEYKAPQSTLFDRPCTYNMLNNIPDLTFNVYDPINGVIPGSIMREIKYCSSVNPASFNVYEATSNAWGSEHVGEVWWDTTNAFFLEYTRAVYNDDGSINEEETRQYKRNNWGKLLPDASIDIYEWVRSPVSPLNWEKYCENQQKLNKDPSTWVPSGSVSFDTNWSQFDEWDSATSEYKTFYYFWVKNPIYVPKISTRHKAVNELTNAITDPLTLNQPWISPIDENAFIISSNELLITDNTSILSLTYQNDVTEVIKHEQYQLCKEGLDYNFNPNIWNSLFNSLTCEEELADGTINTLQYPSTLLGSDSNKTWFKDVIQARREFINSTNNIFKTINLTTNTILMDDVFNVKTNKVNPNQVTFKVIRYNNEYVLSVANRIFVENDAVIVGTSGTLPNPLMKTDVYFVHITDEGYIKLMRTPSSNGSAVSITLTDIGVGKHNIIKQSDYISALGTDLDMTQYWSLTDWYSIGYSENTEYTVETSIDVANTKNYQEGECIRITGSDNIWTLYVKTISRDVVLWQPIGRQNSTIKLNDKIYNGYAQYDSEGKPTQLETNARNAIKLLKSTFDTIQSRLVFDMIKYVHVEQGIVDWVFKTSYIYVVGLEQPLQRNYLQQDDLISQIVTYFEEVKPYRTKIRSQIEQKTSDTDEVNGLYNDLGPNGYILVNGSWVKSEKDIWDYQYAEWDEIEGAYKVHGELPSDFEYPQRPFQESNEVLVFDNVKCTPDSNLTSSQEMEQADKKFKSQNQDRLSAGEHYKIQRFKFSTPVFDDANVGTSILYNLTVLGFNLDLNLGYPEAINSYYKVLKDDYNGTIDFTEALEKEMNAAFNASENIQDMVKYSGYNTLANRLKLYTSKNDTTISYDVGCPFKGLILNDNPNTRLPFGFSAESDLNKGYILKSQDVYMWFKNKVQDENPTFSENEVIEHLIYEYGLYPWSVDISENGKFYSDTYIVLAAMLNNYVLSDSDPYDKAKEILDSPTLDSYCMVLVPRKYVQLSKTGSNETYVVPSNVSLDEFMEQQLISGNEIWELAHISIDDLPHDTDNVLYNELLSVLGNSEGEEYVDDMNSFDNLALESQYKTITYTANGVVGSDDKVFFDISEINPDGRDVSQIKFTVDGYNFDTSGNTALKDYGTFQIEGLVVQNPYNPKEVYVSIPRYEEAMEYLDKSNFNRQEIKYFNHISDVLNVAGEVKIPNHKLQVGDKVIISGAEHEDYYEMKRDGTDVKVLSSSVVKDSNRPKIFTVQAINGDVVTINGLTFDNTFSTKQDSEFMRSDYGSALSVVRITSFNDSSFDGTQKKYSTVRKYSLTVLDYDVFYDRTISSYSYDENEYDLWYISNEVITRDDGTEVDHGFYMPIYAKGSLSELVRTVCTDSLQIFVYEYDETVIKPKFSTSTSKWTYAKPVKDKVYIDSVSASMSVVIHDLDKTYVVKPTEVLNLVLEGDKVQSSNVSDNNLYGINAEIAKARNGYLLRANLHTVERYYDENTQSTVLSLNFGKLEDIDYYADGFDVIPNTYFSTGLPVSTEIVNLLKQK